MRQSGAAVRGKDIEGAALKLPQGEFLPLTPLGQTHMHVFADADLE